MAIVVLYKRIKGDLSLEKILATTIEHFSFLPQSQEKIVSDGGVVLLVDMVNRSCASKTSHPDLKVGPTYHIFC